MRRLAWSPPRFRTVRVALLAGMLATTEFTMLTAAFRAAPLRRR
jgi:hypothetical protein